MRILILVLVLAGRVHAEPLKISDRHAQPPVADGDLTDWAGAKFQTIICGRAQAAEVALAHDATNLYLAYRITHSSPLHNRGQDAQHHFKEGAAVDLMLGPACEKPTTPQTGDLRLLLVPTQPKPVAMLYRQVWPEALPEDRVEFRSPVRTVTFDSVREMPEVTVVFHKTPTGYVCEARVPYRALGITPRAGQTMRGDLGILLANDGGLLTSQRCNLFNQLATTVSDIPTEAELTPAGWGEFVWD
ncbi:MAG: hypothetical protein WCS70_14775 [Verrucomicrobiota bacterium]